MVLLGYCGLDLFPTELLTPNESRIVSDIFVALWPKNIQVRQS